MVDIIDICENEMITSNHRSRDEFKKDVLLGLNQPHKYLSSKYFYDEEGSHLFNKITEHPDYYLTAVELEILRTHKQDIAALMGKKAFNLIELGPGEGIKTKILLDEFLNDAIKFSYIPIDISMKYLEKLQKQYSPYAHLFKVIPIHADYFSGVEWQSEHSTQRNLVLFLGSTIGNLDPQSAKLFLHNMHKILHANDHLLIGFDLKKPISTFIKAYADDKGLTRAFNLNLLKRINRELNGHFNLEKFEHYANYNVYLGAMESFLISLEKQQIKVDALGQTFSFDAFEPIHTEYSYKFNLNQIAELARITGYEIEGNFFDAKHYFVDSLWRVKK